MFINGLFSNLKLNTKKRMKLRLTFMHIQDYLRSLDDIDWPTLKRNNLKTEIDECIKILNDKSKI